MIGVFGLVVMLVLFETKSLEFKSNHGQYALSLSRKLFLKLLRLTQLSNKQSGFFEHKQKGSLLYGYEFIGEIALTII